MASGLMQIKTEKEHVQNGVQYPVEGMNTGVGLQTPVT